VNSHYVVMVTKSGIFKKTSLEAYSRPRSKGVNAIVIREGDELLEAKLTNGDNFISLASKQGRLCTFHESKARAVGRTSIGVRGMDVGDDLAENEVIGMVCVDAGLDESQRPQILVVSENGFGKRSDVMDYRITNRGSKGVKTLNMTEKTGALIAIKDVTDDNDLMIINRSGITIRMAIDSLRVMGRATQGVKLINLREGDSIASVCVVPKSEDEAPKAEDGTSAEAGQPAESANE